MGTKAKSNGLAEILNLLERYQETVRECFYSLDSATPWYDPDLFDITRKIACWCDSGNCNIDPAPLLEIRDLLQQFVRPMRTLGEPVIRPRRSQIDVAYESAIATWNRLFDVCRVMDAAGQLTRPRGKSEFCHILDISLDTLNRRIDDGTYDVDPLSTKRIRMRIDQMPADYDDTRRRY